MADVHFDTSELDHLAADFVDSVDEAMDAAVRVTKRGALNIKNGARARFRSQVRELYLPHYARAIDYDVWESGLEVTAEIGPDSSKPQGGMGPGVELGSVNTAPRPHLFPAFEEEEPRWREHLARAVGDVLS